MHTPKLRQVMSMKTDLIKMEICPSQLCAHSFSKPSGADARNWYSREIIVAENGIGRKCDPFCQKATRRPLFNVTICMRHSLTCATVQRKVFTLFWLGVIPQSVSTWWPHCVLLVLNWPKPKHGGRGKNVRSWQSQ